MPRGAVRCAVGGAGVGEAEAGTRITVHGSETSVITHHVTHPVQLQATAVIHVICGTIPGNSSAGHRTAESCAPVQCRARRCALGAV